MFSMGRLSDRTARYAGYRGTTGDWGAEAEVMKNMSYDDWLRDKVVYGTPDRVSDRLIQLQEELHLSQIIYEVNFGRKIPYLLQTKCLRMLSEMVLPQLK